MSHSYWHGGATHVKIADDVKITTAAPDGNAGTWLIDPTDYTIAAVDPLNGSSYMSNAALETSLDSTNVIIQTLSTGTGNGDIFVNSALTWAANKLTLSAHGDININADLTATGGAALALRYGQGAVAAGNTSQITTTNAAVNLAGTTSYTTTQGSDGVEKAYTVITTLDQLQGMSSNVAANYALGSNIDATATSTWNASTGFAPILGFAGSFDGLGHTISDLFMSKGATASIGLIGSTDVGSIIRNVGLVDGSISGGASTGALVGSNGTGTVYNSYTTGINVSGAAGTGGLVGSNTTGTISYSYATGDVINGVAAGAGGLVGSNTTGNISNSYATGNVGDSATANAGAGSGGLVGSNTTGNISNSYAAGDVHGAAGTGGLVGSNNTGNISNSYASGTITNGISASIGGLMGSGSTGSITNSYATGNVTGGAGAGGLVGDITTGNISNSYAFGAVHGGAGTGGLVGTITSGKITNTYATGSVFGAAGTGGLLGVGTSGVITNSYATGLIAGSGAGRGGLVGTTGAAHVGSFWNKETTDMTTSPGGVGVVGMTTAQMKDPLNFTTATTANNDVNPAWNTASIWTLNSVNYPLLTSLFKNVATVTVNNLTQAYRGAAYTSGYTASTVMATGLTGPLSGTLTYSGTSQTGLNVGSYVITPGGVTYGSIDNPQNPITFIDGTLDITPKALTATIAAASKVYDGTLTAAPVFTVAGLVGTETVTATGAATFNTADVTTANLVTANSNALADGDNGGLASNYSLATGQTVASTITTKALTVTGMSAVHKTYDGTTVARLTGGLIDTGIAGEALTITGQTGIFANKNAADGIAVTVTNTTLISGTGMASNYSVIQPSGLTANITALPSVPDDTALPSVPDDSVSDAPTDSSTIVNDTVSAQDLIFMLPGAYRINMLLKVYENKRITTNLLTYEPEEPEEPEEPK